MHTSIEGLFWHAYLAHEVGYGCVGHWVDLTERMHALEKLRSVRSIMLILGRSASRSLLSNLGLFYWALLVYIPQRAAGSARSKTLGCALYSVDQSGGLVYIIIGLFHRSLQRFRL